MDRTIYSENIDGRRYDVHYDSCIDVLDWDCFESDKEKQEYIEKIEKGLIIPCIVIEYEQCECCLEWTATDSLGGIYVENCQEAIDTFRDCKPYIKESIWVERFANDEYESIFGEVEE
jgi:hypothetical protein